MSTPAIEPAANKDPEICHAELHVRLAALEKTVRELKPAKKSIWDMAQVAGPFLMPIVTAFLGYFLITSVSQGFERQRIQIQGASEMQKILSDMSKAGITQEEAEASAVTLAAFGEHAIAPLVLQLQSGETNRMIAGELGLRAVGMTEPAKTCQRLTDLLANRSRLYRWTTHRTALVLLGELRCEKAAELLRNYEQLLQRGLPAYSAVVSEEPAPTEESLDLLRRTLSRSQQIVNQ